MTLEQKGEVGTTKTPKLQIMTNDGLTMVTKMVTPHLLARNKME
jgi:hypothetical protein